MTASGQQAEAFAAAFFERKGLRLLARNYRCRFGEIDLIARDGATLVFVEVRLRSRTDFGTAAESINAAKRRKLVAAARHYLARSGADQPCRFDAFLVGQDGAAEWLKNVICD
jgi:putative endonuclease